MQKFVSRPSDKLGGIYKVARWNEVTSEYEELATPYLTEADANNAAKQFNEGYNEELARKYEYVHQDELINKYHSFANSPEIQKAKCGKRIL